MAHVQLTALAADVRGSLAGSSFRHGRTGLLLHTKPQRAQSRNRFEQIAKVRFSYINQAWRTLSEAQRGTWLSANENGQSGFKLFQARNQQVILVGQQLLKSYRPTLPFAYYVNYAVLQVDGGNQIRLTARMLNQATGSRLIILGTKAYNQKSLAANAESFIIGIIPTPLILNQRISQLYISQGRQFPVIGQWSRVEAYTMDFRTGAKTAKWSKTFKRGT